MKPISALFRRPQEAPPKFSSERRAATRFEIVPGTVANLRILDIPQQTMPVTVKDISQFGMHFTTSRHLPPGSCVQIDLVSHILLGVVVYCRDSNGEMDVGVELEHSVKLA